MERKARSLRGEVVNFDLFAIKEQMSEAPITITNKQREKFIDLKKRRGSRKILNSMVAESQQEEAEAETPSVDASEIAFDTDTGEEPVAVPARRKIARKGE